MSKKKREEVTPFTGIKKGASSKVLSKRDRRAIFMENVEYFHIARALYASRPSSDVPHTFTADDMLKPSFFPCIAQEYYEMYETYVGDHGGREPRFQFDYLFNIELPVLRLFLPHLRYADKFNEVRETTTFSVRPDSIQALIRRRNDQEHFAVEDVTGFSVDKNCTVVAPWDCNIVQIVPIQKPGEIPEGTEGTSDRDSFHEVLCDCAEPKYDDIDNRYYRGSLVGLLAGDPRDCDCDCSACRVNEG